MKLRLAAFGVRLDCDVITCDSETGLAYSVRMCLTFLCVHANDKSVLNAKLLIKHSSLSGKLQNHLKTKTSPKAEAAEVVTVLIVLNLLPV